MSQDDRRTDEHDCGGDVAAYALGALDEAQAAAFRTHLEGCAVCQDELAAFAQVVDALPTSVPAYRAPRRLRRRVLRAIAAERRGPHAPARRPVRLRPALAVAGAGALAVAAIVLVLALGSSSAPRVIAAQVSGPGSASLKVSSDHAELVVHHLSPAPDGQIYEVWLKRGPTGAPAPARALFSVNDAGDADVKVPDSLHGVTTVMVTREPAGGTERPTHAPVIVASLD
jgi:anti-sigma factor RsiW